MANTNKPSIPSNTAFKMADEFKRVRGERPDFKKSPGFNTCTMCPAPELCHYNHMTFGKGCPKE